MSQATLARSDLVFQEKYKDFAIVHSLLLVSSAVGESPPLVLQNLPTFFSFCEVDGFFPRKRTSENGLQTLKRGKKQTPNGVITFSTGLLLVVPFEKLTNTQRSKRRAETLTEKPSKTEPLQDIQNPAGRNKTTRC